MTFGVMGTGGLFTPQGSFHGLMNLANQGGGQAQQPQAQTPLQPLPQTQTIVPQEAMAESQVQQPPQQNSILNAVNLAGFPVNRLQNIGDYQVVPYSLGRGPNRQFSVTNTKTLQGKDGLDLAQTLALMENGKF